MKIKLWEKALFIALAFTLCFSAVASAQQRGLSDKLVRLHVVGASNSDEDQAAKLKIRDAVIAYLEPLLEGAADREEAEARIAANIGGISEAASSAAVSLGQEGAVAELAVEDFPTRDYDGFSLPAGEYTALRVTVGAGEGKNWWCVPFPPLCVTAAEGKQALAASGISEGEADMITSGYTVKFRVLELIEIIKAWFK